MAARAQAKAIKNELVARATGKGNEPTWEGEPTKLQLVQALNFYSATTDTPKLHQYAIAWAKKFCPEKVRLIVEQDEWIFRTFGALMRIESRGLKLPKDAAESIQTFVKGLTMPEVETKPTTKIKGKKKMSNGENVNYRAFCDAMDKATGDKDFKKVVLEVDPQHSVAQVIEVCERELESMKEDPTIYPEHMKKWFRAVIKQMQSVEPPANDSAPKVLKKVAKTAAAKPEKAKPAAKAPPKKTAAKSTPKTEKAKPAAPEPETNSHPLNGKTVAYLFDTRYGRLTKMVAVKGGFSVKGKTISGIDEKKSKVALLKNYGDAMKPGAANEELENWMTKCVKKGNPIKVGGRLSDAILVLNAA